MSLRAVADGAAIHGLQFHEQQKIVDRHGLTVLAMTHCPVNCEERSDAAIYSKKPLYGFPVS